MTCGCPAGHAAVGLPPVNAGFAASNLALFVDFGRQILRLWRHIVKQSKELGSRRFISTFSPLPSHSLMFIFLVSFCPSQPLSFFPSCLFVLCALSLPGSDKTQEIRTSASVFSHVTSHLLLWTLPEETHAFSWQVLINWTPLPPKCRMATEFSSGVIQTRAKLPCWVCDGQLASGKALLNPCLCNHFGSPAAGGYCVWYSEQDCSR